MKYLLIFLSILISLNFVIASTCPTGIYPCNPDVQFNNPIQTSGTSSTNYSILNVNNSLFWQGHTGTDGSWLTGISTYNLTYDSKPNSNSVCYTNGTGCTSSGDSWSSNYTNYYNKSDNYAIGQVEAYSPLDVYVNATAQFGNIQSPFFNLGTKSNYILQSEAFMTTWINNTGRPIISNSNMAPTDTLIAENLNGTSIGASVYQISGNRSNGCWTFSTYLRRVNGAGNNVTIRINMTNQTGIDSPINLTGEWKRYSVSNCFTAGGNVTVAIIVNQNNLSVWGGQLDNSAIVRAYYPTTTAIVGNTQNTYFPLAVVSGVGVAVGGALSGATTGAFSGIITNTIQALFISQDGIVTTSTTATTASAPIQHSPRIRLSGVVWDLGSGASRTTNFIEEVMSKVGETGRNSSASLDWSYGYNDVTNYGFNKLMSLDSNGSLDVTGLGYDNSVLNNSNFTGNSSWVTNGGWRINTVTNMANYTFSLGATGNLTQSLTDFNITVKPNRQYELAYNISGTPVAGCLAYIPTTFATNRVYLQGVSITTANTPYNIHFKTNSNPSNFTITAVCTAGQFFLDQLILREITSGDIIANGKFTGGGTEGIKVDGLGNVNITGNVTIAGVYHYQTTGNCNLTLNHSVCLNQSGMYIIA